MAVNIILFQIFSSYVRVNYFLVECEDFMFYVRNCCKNISVKKGFLFQTFFWFLAQLSVKKLFSLYFKFFIFYFFDFHFLSCCPNEVFWPCFSPAECCVFSFRFGCRLLLSVQEATVPVWHKDSVIGKLTRGKKGNKRFLT